MTFVLTSGGHNAGIVSEPGHKGRSYRISHRAPGAQYVDPKTWYDQTKIDEGSWWPAWLSWLDQQTQGRTLGRPNLALPVKDTGRLKMRRADMSSSANRGAIEAPRHLSSARGEKSNVAPWQKGTDRRAPMSTASPLRSGELDYFFAPKLAQASNGEAVARQVLGSATGLRQITEQGQAPGGHTYSRVIYNDPEDVTICEHWRIHRAGHAWAGGSSSGSYTDPLGPDASREMVRFFLERERNN